MYRSQSKVWKLLSKIYSCMLITVCVCVKCLNCNFHHHHHHYHLQHIFKVCCCVYEREKKYARTNNKTNSFTFVCTSSTISNCAKDKQIKQRERRRRRRRRWRENHALAYARTHARYEKCTIVTSSTQGKYLRQKALLHLYVNYMELS